MLKLAKIDESHWEIRRVLYPKPSNFCCVTRLNIALIVIFAVLPACVFADSFEVENIRVAKNGQVTRVVFDTSATPSYKTFVLNNPRRVVIDLIDAKLSTTVNQAIFKSSFVAKLRHANQSNNKLRIVLDLNQQITAKSFALPPNGNSHHRLVIDLKNSQAANTQLAKTPATTPKRIEKAASKPKSKTLVIAIDPGHGGKDPGAIGYAGTREKDVVLQISQRLVRLINAKKGMRAIMTRSSDKFLTLRGRMKKARDQKADIFISVHADAVHDRRVRGSSVYILSKNGASSEAARFLAKSQNESDLIGGVKLNGKGKDVQKVLVDLSQAATINASMKLANSVKKELSTLGKTRKNVEHAGFAVLKSPDIPSILVETAFISNVTEEKKLRSTTHQQKLASSIFKGLEKYLKNHSPNNAILVSNINTDKHTIKHGETLSAIAIQYSVSIDAIRKTNALRTDRIHAGQKLIIPEV